jgi:hypothetical protein
MRRSQAALRRRQAWHEARAGAKRTRPCIRVDRTVSAKSRKNGRITRTMAEKRLSAVRLRTSRRNSARSLNRRGNSVEDLGQVAADISLDGDGRDCPAKVVTVEPLGHAASASSSGQPEPVLRLGPSELALGRLGDLLDNQIDRLRDAPSRAQRPGHQAENVRQLFLEAACAVLTTACSRRAIGKTVAAIYDAIALTKRFPSASCSTAVRSRRHREQMEEHVLVRAQWKSCSLEPEYEVAPVNPRVSATPQSPRAPGLWCRLSPGSSYRHRAARPLHACSSRAG